MATLTNTKIKDTYDGLLKTTNNEAIGASGVTLIEDGLGNASALSVGRSGNGVTITGSLNATLATAAQPNITSVGTLSSLAVSGNLAVDTNTLYVDASNNRVGIGTSSPRTDINASSASGSIITLENSSTALNSGDSLGKLNFYSNDSSSSASGIKASIDAEVESGFAATSLTFSTAGYLEASATERMRIDSSGNVRLSGTAPSAEDTISKIDFYNNSSSINLAGIEGKRTAGGTNYGSLIFNTTNSGTSSEKMRIDSSGNVGIGGTATDFASNRKTLEVKSGQGAYILASDITNSAYCQIAAEASVGYVGMRTNHPLAIVTNNTERMRITSGGDVFIGKTSTGIANDGVEINSVGQAFFTCTGGAGVQVNRKGADGNAVTIYNDSTEVGSISVSGSSTSFNTSSDYRLKENVVPMEGALDRVDALKPSRFNFIADDDKTVDGFIAHEVQDIVPEAVTGEKDAVDEEGNPIYQGIDQSKLVPLLVGAIQELRAEIELLKNK